SDVVQRADLPQNAPIRAARRMSNMMYVPQRAVRMNHPVFDVHGARPAVQLEARLPPARMVGRMHHRLQVVVYADVRLPVAPPQHAIELRRPIILVFAVEVHDVIAEIGDLLRDRELSFAAPERLLGVAADSDVADETDETRRLDAAHPADGQLRGKFTAVAALGEQLATAADDARLAGVDVAAQVVFVLGTVGLGQQDIDLQADHFLLVVAEHALAGMVQQLDATLVIEQHDSIDGGVQDGLELPFEPMCALFLR